MSLSPLQDRLIAERHRAQARAAQLVDAPGRALDRNAGGDRGLPRRVLALPGGEDLAHDDFGDAAAFDAGALERGLDRGLAELVRRQIGEGAVEGPDRRARGADNDDVVLHSELSWLCGSASLFGSAASLRRSARRVNKPDSAEIAAKSALFAQVAERLCCAVSRLPRCHKTAMLARRIGYARQGKRETECSHGRSTKSRSRSRNTPTGGSTTPAPAPTSRSKTSREMVKEGEDFVVYDAKTGEDITRSVLAQIIFEQENKEGQNLLPIAFLRQLIRFYGDSMQMLVPRYLEAVDRHRFTKEQGKFREQMAQAFGVSGFGPLEEQVRRNMEMFEKTFAMFAPFARGEKVGRQAASRATRSTNSSGSSKRCRSASTGWAVRADQPAARDAPSAVDPRPLGRRQADQRALQVIAAPARSICAVASSCTHSATVCEAERRARSIMVCTKARSSSERLMFCTKTPSILTNVDAELAQVAERGVAGAEIVDRDLAAEILDARDEAARLVDVADRGGLGDLDGEPLADSPDGRAAWRQARSTSSDRWSMPARR